MKRIVLFLAICISLASSAFAQGGMGPGPGTVHSAGGGGYVGLGDTKSGAVAYYGHRAYTAAIAAAGTQALYRLSRASDTHECDILTATTGFEGLTSNCGTGGDNGQSKAAFCAATTCTEKSWYDQTGNGNNAGNTLVINQPGTLNTGCTSGTFGCAQFVTARGTFLQTSGNVTYGAGFTVVAVSRRPTSGAAGMAILTFATPLLFYNNAANQILLSGDLLTFVGPTTVSDAAFHSVIGVFNGASSCIYIDGSCGGATNGGTNGGSPSLMTIGSQAAGMSLCDCLMSEVAFYNSALSGGDATAISAEAHSSWAF